TVGACAPPVLGATIGWFNGQTSGLVAGTLIGLPIMVALMLLFYQAAWLKVFQTGILAAILFVIASAIGALVIVGLSSVMLPLWTTTPATSTTSEPASASALLASASIRIESDSAQTENTSLARGSTCPLVSARQRQTPLPRCRGPLDPATSKSGRLPTAIFSL